MKKYLMIGVHHTVEFCFRERDGLLCGVTFPEELSDRNTIYLIDNLPHDYEELQTLAKKFSAVLREVPQDLSFEAFWDTYNYKVGNKARVKKLWQALPQQDRAACIVSLARYDQYLKLHPRMERAYPETYINQRRFENQFNS
jgi:hypothetical protein